jgi:hypothetical protein
MFGLSVKQIAVTAAIAVVAIAIAKKIPFTAKFLA